MLADIYGSRQLGAKEYQIIRLVANGLKNKEVAVAVGTTEHVIKNYLRVIYDKIGLWNRVELALWFMEHERSFINFPDCNSTLS